MTCPTDPDRSVVFDNNDGSLMRRLELNFRGVKATTLDPWSLAVLRRRKPVMLTEGMVKMTDLGTLVFQESAVENPESRAKQVWTLPNARLADLGLKLSAT